MTTNKDEFVSQYELHDLESLGLIKVDLLAVEALDRVRACIDLLVQYGYAKKEKTLKETYENIIGVYKIERENQEMWKLVWENRIISLFQMEQGSGIQAIALTKPHSLEDLAAINSVMRLMASERGAEQPLNKYARFKDSHPHAWEREMIEHGLSEEERLMMHKYLDYEYGICATQEDLMSMVQNPLIGGFSLSWADKLRKAIAKKQPVEFNKLTDEFFANAKEKGLSQALTNYVWNVLFVTQRG